MFSWVQRKLKGKQETTKTSTRSCTSYTRTSTCGEEFSDWPNELLAIGTFGNTQIPKPLELPSLQETPSPLKKDPQNDDIVEESGGSDIVVVEEFSTCLENLQDHSENCGNLGNMDGRFERTLSLAERRGHYNIHLDNEKNTRDSLSYLFKKAFACSGGFSPNKLVDPLFPRDSLFPEPKCKTSKLEKIFRAILHKKVYPQGSSPRTTLQKYLDTKNRNETESEDEKSDDESDDGGKWVKNDSEYIVLEI